MHFAMKAGYGDYPVARLTAEQNAEVRQFIAKQQHEVKQAPGALARWLGTKLSKREALGAFRPREATPEDDRS